MRGVVFFSLSRYAVIINFTTKLLTLTCDHFTKYVYPITYTHEIMIGTKGFNIFEARLFVWIFRKKEKNLLSTL